MRNPKVDSQFTQSIAPPQLVPCQNAKFLPANIKLVRLGLVRPGLLRVGSEGGSSLAQINLPRRPCYINMNSSHPAIARSFTFCCGIMPMRATTRLIASQVAVPAGNGGAAPPPRSSKRLCRGQYVARYFSHRGRDAESKACGCFDFDRQGCMEWIRFEVSQRTNRQPQQPKAGPRLDERPAWPIVGKNGPM